MQAAGFPLLKKTILARNDFPVSFLMMINISIPGHHLEVHRLPSYCLIYPASGSYSEDLLGLQLSVQLFSHFINIAVNIIILVYNIILFLLNQSHTLPYLTFPT